MKETIEAVCQDEVKLECSSQTLADRIDKETFTREDERDLEYQALFDDLLRCQVEFPTRCEGQWLILSDECTVARTKWADCVLN